MINKNILSDSVRRALWLGIASSSAFVANAHAQEATSESSEVKTLEAVQVTGSRIPRTQQETASPIYTVNKEAIEKTGALTIGDFLQEIPSVSGAATNPSVNNGGGEGKATVSLRGLSEERTLILINGRRIVTDDVNSIPMSMVQNVEVLKDGASAVYGSDAVGGVVNFILSKNYEGLQVRADYGISSRDDGQRQGVSLTWGKSSERGNIVLSANYNKQEEVRASDRDYSFFALSLGSTSSTGVVQGGSSRALTGRYFINNDPALVTLYGCNSVTLTPGQPGTALSDFRCFSFGRDAFNYQAVGNLQLTPQERAGLFVSANYDITDNVTGYIDAFVNNTRSASQIAPLPFDGLSDGINLSEFNQYNPFGVQIDDIRLRLSRLGNRRYEYKTDVSQINAGLKGEFADSSWTWDYNLSYGSIDQENQNFGYIDYAKLADALGPSQGGVCYTDGTFTTPIPNCVPINFVGAFDPNTAAGQAQLAALKTITVDAINNQKRTYRGFQANFGGDLFEMKNGTAKAAFGLEYRKNSLDFDPFALAIINPGAGYTCGISSEICTAPTNGSVTVRELYGEALFPFTTNFNMTLGTRWSSYSSFGKTLNSKIGADWNVSEQFKARATFAQVFRAPRIEDLFAGETAASDTFTDPCNGITVANNPACINVVPDGTFSQTDTQLNAIKGGNPDLRAEEGETITFGFVYEPSWLDGFSTTVDFWRVKLDDAIKTYGTQNILNACFNSTAANPSPFCSLFTRRPSGEMEILFDKRANVGTVTTSGVDIGFRYRLDTENLGAFRFNLDTTYTREYKTEVIFNGIRINERDDAGTFLSSANGGDGNYSKWRALGNIGWAKGRWDASWNMRYVDGFTVGSLSSNGVCANRGLPPGSPGCQFSIGSYTYHNVQAGAKFGGFKVRLGVDNVNDKQPPILYQNNSLNGNTDERTFDTVGRYYWTSVSYDF
jgi:iron complex outermembrane recepter protein